MAKATRTEVTRLELVPGLRVTPLQYLLFPRSLLGAFSPFNLYGRWRQLLADLVPGRLFEENGLNDVTHEHPGKFDRQLILLQCLRNVIEAKTPGAVMEFGCFRGHTALHLAETMRSLGDSSKLYLFDSFEGLPESAAPEDADWRAGDLAADHQEVVLRFRKFGNVEVVKGFFADVLSGFPNVACKFAHVDADLYVSIREVSEWLLERIVPGGMVIYDDYGFASCEGARKAVDEAMQGRSDFFKLDLPSGQFVALKRG